MTGVWYRIWSDGWIEQGGYTPNKVSGNVIVTLFLEYRDTEYIVFTEQINTDNDSEASVGAYSSLNKTTSSFQITRYATLGYYWVARGY
jgi:hypothetical protein